MGLDDSDPKKQDLTEELKALNEQFQDNNYFKNTYLAYTKFLYNAGNALGILKMMLSSRGNMDVNEAIKCIRKMK